MPSAISLPGPVSRRRSAVSARFLAATGLVCLLYIGAAKLGLSLAYENQSISAVWAPSGIALAALVIGGRHMWIGVALGAFLANYVGGGSVAVQIAALIAVGNTLEAVGGAYLLRRFGVRQSLDRLRDVSILIAAAAVSTMVSASVGTLSLSAFGLLDIGALPSSWLLWWLADLSGALLVAPLLLVIAAALKRPKPRRSVIEGGVILAALALVEFVIFVGKAPLEYLAFPLIVFAAYRAGQVGAVLSSFLLAAISVPMTAMGRGHFAHHVPDWGMLLSQTFCSSAAMTALFLGAATLERTRARQELEAVVVERTALLEERSRQLNEAHELDRAKDEVVALVSHDLRTPLTSILGYTTLLRADADVLGETQRDYLEVIDRSGQRLLTLVDDLLVAAQHKVGAFSVSRLAPVDISELVYDAARAMAPAATRRGLQIQVLPSAEPAVVMGDRDRLARMFDNLLANAIKYSYRGRSIEVSIDRTDSAVRLCVWNDGREIPADEQGRIFERFERSRDGIDTGAKGFGLGLTIARAIAEAHCGSIGVDSAEGFGVTFWVEIPRADVPVAPLIPVG